MTQFLHFFSLENVAFTIWKYPVSWLEFTAIVFTLWSVTLATRNRVGTWPVGLVGVVLFFILFYKSRFYADMVEQFYYLFASLYGWWTWSRVPTAVPSRNNDAHTMEGAETAAGDTSVPIVWSSVRSSGTLLAVGIALSVMAGWATSNLHIWRPDLFTKPAVYPYVDATTTVMSFIATGLMARKRLECWIYWLVIDVVGVWLYFVQGLVFTSLQYVVFLFLAGSGLIHWRRIAAVSSPNRQSDLEP